ncbi:MAG: FKBP-type peptidyl-prolyl cis-trans isomerase [Bacteroidetes bacterium]|nr:FKBP-type peptidyl-prolyl cis-trans isomerase [Bacteroidota bacterium]
MNNIEEGRSKAPIIISGIALLAVVGGILSFIFKPYGDVFPFDDMLYKVSKVSKMKYRILNKGKGKKIKNEEMAFLNFSYRKKKQKKYVFNTKNQKMQWPFQYKTDLKDAEKQGFNNKLNEAVGMLRKKGKIRIRLTLNDMFTPKDEKEKKMFMKKNNIKKGEEIIVEFDIEKISTQKQYEEENKKKFKEFTEKIKAKVEARFKEEHEIIKKEIKKESKDKPGIKYHEIKDKGKKTGIFFRYLPNTSDDLKENAKLKIGRVAKKGYDLKVRYKMKIVGDKNNNNMGSANTTTFEIGKHQVIRGWELGLLNKKVGDKLFMYIPSKYAYGITGAQNFIKPNQILAYEIKILKIMD